MLLSAQTTDKAVNEATPTLFALAPDAAAMAATPIPDIQACIKRLGLAPTKARNLQAMAQVGGGGLQWGGSGGGSRRGMVPTSAHGCALGGGARTRALAGCAGRS